MQASAGFVSASALGMACGPALAGLLQWRFKIYMVTFSQSTLPGWLMAVAWLLYLVWLCISFKEPNRATEADDTPHNRASGNSNTLCCCLRYHLEYALKIKSVVSCIIKKIV